jgi:hypothetical protein
VVCEVTGKEINSMVDLKTIKRGWHNIIVTCDNICESGEGSVKFFIDGKQTYPE